MLEKLVQVNLEDQYKGFNICFWVMLVIATIAALFGQSTVAIAIGTLGLVSGAIAQLKLILMNQNKFLANQETFLGNQEKFLANQDKFLANQKLFLETLEEIKKKG